MGYGLGTKVWGLGFGHQDLGVRVEGIGLGIRDDGLAFGIWV